METITRYFSHLQNKLNAVLEHEVPNIEKAAQMVAESCKNGGRFYVFGSGHSHLVAEELYLRSGGLALVHAIPLPSGRRGAVPAFRWSGSGPRHSPPGADAS